MRSFNRNHRSSLQTFAFFIVNFASFQATQLLVALIVRFFVGTVRDLIVKDFSVYDLSVLYFELQLVDMYDIVRSVTSLAILDLSESYHPEANANRLPARSK